MSSIAELLKSGSFLTETTTIMSTIAFSTIASKVFSKEIKEFMIRRMTYLSIIALSSAPLLLGSISEKAKKSSKIPSESAVMAASGLNAFITCSLICLSLSVLGYSLDSGLFYEMRLYFLSLLIIIIAYRALFAFRVARGFYGLNEAETIEFYIWLKEKSKKGGNDFGGKAVEDLKEDFLTEIGYDRARFPGAYS